MAGFSPQIGHFFKLILFMLITSYKSDVCHLNICCIYFLSIFHIGSGLYAAFDGEWSVPVNNT